MNEPRGYIITATTIKKHWFRENEIKITITDGEQVVRFYTTGSFTIPSDIPFPKPLISKD